MNIIHVYYIILILDSINSRLLFVYEHFRHGNRGPTFKNNNKKNIDMYGVEWDNSGELTPIGLRKQYLLGRHNKMKYNNFLSEQYDPNEIEIYSSPLRRTIMSAQAQLHGMYSEYGQKIPENLKSYAYPEIDVNEEMKKEITKLDSNDYYLNNQIIPIQEVDLLEFNTILLDESICPNMKNIRKNMRNSEEFNNRISWLNQTYGQKLLKYLNKSDTNYLFDYYTIFYMSDYFIADYLNGKNLSKFKSYGIDLYEYYKFCYNFMNFSLFQVDTNIDLTGISMSVTIPKLIDLMDTQIEAYMKHDKDIQQSKPKFIIFSAHDTTMAPLQLFMKNVFNVDVEYPQFSSNIFIELHSNDSDDNDSIFNRFYIKYFFNGNLKLQIDYHTFKSLALDHIWTHDKIRKFCVEADNGTDYILIAIFIHLIIMGFILCWKYRSFINYKQYCENKIKRDFQSN